MGIFRALFFFRPSEEKRVMRVLRKLELQKQPIQMEVEGEGIRFKTIIAIKRGMVLVARPAALKREIKANSFVRFTASEAGKDHHFRLQVKVPMFHLLSGTRAFLCEIPTTFADQSRRKNFRYNTTRFNNLFLTVPLMEKQFRIVDISDGGCRIVGGDNAKVAEETAPQKRGKDRKQRVQELLNERPRDALEVGFNTRKAQIVVGRNVTIELELLETRTRLDKTAGLRFQVARDGESPKLMAHFLKQLEDSLAIKYQINGPGIAQIKRQVMTAAMMVC